MTSPALRSPRPSTNTGHSTICLRSVRQRPGRYRLTNVPEHGEHSTCDLSPAGAFGRWNKGLLPRPLVGGRDEYGVVPPNQPYAQLRETHTAFVVLCGDRAYKVKKPIATDFLDFRTPESRERACARELELNRRLAADVYLGISHATDPTGGADEPMVVMRRMPESRRLASLLDNPTASAEVSELARVIADFHRTADRSAEIDRAGTLEALRDRWQVLLRRFPEHPRLERLAMRYIEGRKPLLAARIAEHHIIDGHGDLHADDIFAMPDGFRILDCLDFDDQLRYVDGLDDAAFLAMDLEFLGHPDLATRFLDEYVSAAADPAPRSLRHHYVAYRALVRAKVNSIRVEQGDSDAATHLQRHLDLATCHLEQGSIRLALVGGLPGTGKSTVAENLSAATDAVVISTDVERAHLRASGIIDGCVGVFGVGTYSPAGRAFVYSDILDLARHHLEQGNSVILDASWTEESERLRAASLATDVNADLIELHCVCDRSLAAQRIELRHNTYSDATPHIASAMATTASPWPSALTLDTSRPLTETTAKAFRAWTTPASQPVPADT